MLPQHALVLVLLSSTLVGCSQVDTSTVAREPSVATNPVTTPPLGSVIPKLRFQARPAFEISLVEQRHDTLLLVSANPAVAYPLGKLASPKGFQARYPGFALTFRDEDPDSTGVVRVYTATKGTNVVRLFKPTENESGPHNWLEIASGTLTDPSLSLATGVHVGMSQQAFLTTFFTAPLTLPSRPVSTLALIYVVDGEMQYCHVRRGVIDKIQLASVFTIQ
jgi:hypothetical protein